MAKEDKLTLTIPISDTLPGPGNMQFTVDSNDDWYTHWAVEDPAESETEPGQGTAQDVPSS